MSAVDGLSSTLGRGIHVEEAFPMQHREGAVDWLRAAHAKYGDTDEQWMQRIFFQDAEHPAFVSANVYDTNTDSTAVIEPDAGTQALIQATRRSLLEVFAIFASGGRYNWTQYAIVDNPRLDEIVKLLTFDQKFTSLDILDGDVELEFTDEHAARHEPDSYRIGSGKRLSVAGVSRAMERCYARLVQPELSTDSIILVTQL